jgi:hypothetical protein
MLYRWACPSVNLPIPLSEDVDLGLIEPVSTVSVAASDDSNLENISATDEVRGRFIVSGGKNLNPRVDFRISCGCNLRGKIIG